MRTNFENIIRLNIKRLADLKMELERELSDTPASFSHEFVEPAHRDDAVPDNLAEPCNCALHQMSAAHEAVDTSVLSAPQNSGHGGRAGQSSARLRSSPNGRTASLLNNGRRSVYHSGLSSRKRKAIGGAVVVVVLIAIQVMILTRGGPSWPSSVATVERQISIACQNPDVKSDPGQVNFACGKNTRQILWVFSLLTSANNPNFLDPKTGRRGLEPITPAQGGALASSLNLHHPYNPANPIDSLQVAARAINNIIGGATLTGPNGKPVVQPGLESHPANCQRYTGSPAVISRGGFPNLCARPVTGPEGQAALVADVYRKWVVGTTAKAAQDAAVLFQNAKNPGDPRVQSILKHLPNSRLSA